MIEWLAGFEVLNLSRTTYLLNREFSALEPTPGKLLRLIEGYRNEILEFTAALMRIRSENPPGRSYRECADCVENKLKAIGLDFQEIKVPRNEKFVRSEIEKSESDIGYCIQSSFGKGKKILYFHGHYDVVPASNESQFHPYVEDGRLVGRGSADMKGGLASMIYAVKAIQACDAQLDGRLALTIVPDEETGGLNGSEYLAENGLLGVDAIGMVMPEPRSRSDVIWNANRGAISLRVTVNGTPAHVGVHYQGVNAFELMLKVANRLEEYKTEVEARKTEYKIQPEAAQRSILLIGGQCVGGTNFNLVPGQCSFTIDRRFNPEEDFDEEKQRLLSITDEMRKNIRLDVQILQEGRSSASSEDTSIAKALSSSIEQITGRRPIFELCPALLETRFYAARGIPSFSYGPGLLSAAHGPDEFVDVNDLIACAKIYALTAVRTLNPSLEST
jgi:acetylornithine deacetylase/succinyl-diaminopimelate desuccinylase family protein